MITASTVGRTTVGASWTTMNQLTYLVPVTIPAASLLAGVEVYIRHKVANAPTVGAYVYADAAGSPNHIVAFSGAATGNGVLATNAGRWFHFPIGLWVPSATTFWIGISRSGSTSWDIASDAAGGSGGILSGLNDWSGWTPGTVDYSIHGLLLS